MPGDWFDSGGKQRAVDVPALLDNAAMDGLLELVACGALIGLGTTSDGGALMVQVTVDGRYRREYFRDPESLVEWLSEAIPAVKDAIDRLNASPDQESRSRRRRGR